MLFRDICLLTESGRAEAHQYVGTLDDRIAYIGDSMPAEDYGEVYEGKNKLLMPAFYNAHSHAAMTLLRGYGENLKLSDWLNTRVFPFEAKLRGEDIYWGAQLAFAEMLRYGAASATDMYFFGEDMARAVLETGVKCNLSLGVTCFDGSGLSDLPVYGEYQNLLRQSSSWSDRLRLDLCIHGEYTSTPKVVRQMAEFAGETGLRVHIHLSETQQEQEACKARHGGMTPARYFESLGLFDAPVTAAHCVWLEGDDYRILREKQVTAATCPASNCKLASGFCNVPRLLEEGVTVALGTDGAASNNSLDMMADMKLMALLAKAVSGDPTAVTPEQSLRIATRNGALSQGRGDCGVIRVGAKADLTVLDLESPSLHPVHDLPTHLVYSAHGGDVCLTMADGKVLYQNGDYLTIDVERVKAEAAKSKERILKSL